MASGHCLSLKQENLYVMKRKMEQHSKKLKDKTKVEKELYPLTMAEINYLCIDKCTVVSKKNEKGFLDQHDKIKIK